MAEAQVKGPETGSTQEREHAESSQELGGLFFSAGGLLGGQKEQLRQSLALATQARAEALGEESLVYDSILGTSAVNPAIDKHVAIMSDERFSHPANAERSSRIANRMQQNYGNGHVQRVVDTVHDQQAPGIQRDLSDTIQRWPPEGQQGRSFPINWNNQGNPWDIGDYQAAISLHGMLSLSPFGVEVIGERDGLFITGDQNFNFVFGEGEFRSFEGEVEAGPLSLEFSTEDAEATITVDVLGIVWPEQMQQIVSRVGEITSDFTMTFARRDGEVVLSRIGMDLGLQLGPEQAHALAELSIATEYTEEGPATTTAEGSVSLHLNVCGVERDITLAEGEATVGDIRTRHEQQLRQFALREAFSQTYNDLPGTQGMRTDQARSYLWSGFNTWYSESYNRLHRRVVEHYTEEGYDNADDIVHSNLTPLSIFGGPSVVVASWARGIIQQVILQDTDPPGSEVVHAVWNDIILPGTRGGGQGGG